MTKYQQFLQSIGIISEDLFNEILSSFPDDISIESVHWDWDDFDNVDNISKEIISSILDNYDYVYCEDANFKNKTFELWDVSSIKDLTDIINKLPKWTLTNYDEIINSLQEDQENDECTGLKYKVFNSFVDKIPLNELEKLKEKYE